MESVKACIDAAVQICHTARSLATELDMHEATLALVRSGKRGLTPEQIIKLARILAVPPTELLALDAIARERDPEKQEALREGFFRLGIRGAKAGCLILATFLSAGSSPPASAHGANELSKVDNLYIVAHWLRRLFAPAPVPA